VVVATESGSIIVEVALGALDERRRRSPVDVRCQSWLVR